MASTSLEIVISANDRFSSTADRVIGKLHGVGSASKQVGKGVGELGLGLAKVAVVGFGALAGGLVAASKAGIDFEDAFAGVRKTVGGSKAGLDAMYEDLRKLATRIPVKFTDLAGIATEAGALGVPSKEIVHFTEVIARLSAATQGLTVEAASEAIGKLGNILHIHGNDVDRFASSLVALGNAGASTEADIIETAKRFGAAGSAAKLSAADVLGFSSAIASLGVEPEAAGSSLSRLFNKITRDIGTGDAKLKQFADTAGLSEKAFTTLFKKDSTAGLLAFLKGLSKLDRFQVAKVLKDAGITNIRDVNAVLLLSQNYDLLAQQLGISSTAFKENTALTEASTARFGTLKSKLEIVKNTILDAGVSIAQGLNPAIGRLADKLSAFVTAHKGDFVKFGQDVGKFIDDIDWTKVQHGAETFLDVMKSILGVIQKIPPEVDAAVAAFLGVNKVSGGLIGKGLGDIAGGIGGIVTRAIGAALPGKLGGIVGALGAQPVFVTNWPLGGLGGGLSGAGPGAAGGLSLLGALAALGGVAAIEVGLAGIAGDWLKANVPGWGTPQGAGNIGPVVIGGQSQSQAAHAAADAAMAAGGPPSSANDREDRALTAVTTIAGKLADDRVNLPQLLKAVAAEWKNAADRLAHPKSQADLVSAFRETTKLLTSGRGSAKETVHAIDEMKKQLGHIHDPKLHAEFAEKIRKIEGLLPGRQFAAQELANEKKLLSSHLTTSQKITGLQRIESDLLHHGLPHAAAQIQKKIDEAKKAQKEAARLTTEAVKDKDLSVKVNVSVPVSIREFYTGAGVVRRYFGTSSSASAGK